MNIPEGKYGPVDLIYDAIHYAPYILLGAFVVLAVVMTISIIINRKKK